MFSVTSHILLYSEALPYYYKEAPGWTPYELALVFAIFFPKQEAPPTTFCIIILAQRLKPNCLIFFCLKINLLVII